MDEQKAWREVEKVLSDTKGKYWGKIREHLEKPIQTLSNNLSIEKFKSHINKVDEYKSDETYFGVQKEGLPHFYRG